MAAPRIPLGRIDVAAYRGFLTRSWQLYSYRRVSGLAVESAFWTVFSLPWLLLGFVASSATFDRIARDDTTVGLHEGLTELVSASLGNSGESFIGPVLDRVFARGTAGMGALGFAVALWSGSRAVLAFVQATAVINGEPRARGFVSQRALAVGLYLGAVVVMSISMPLAVEGPANVMTAVGAPEPMAEALYFILVCTLVLCLLTSLYHLSARARSRWRDDLPGAIFALVAWAVGSVFLSMYADRLNSPSSIYGVLGAPAAIMIFTYFLCLMALVGAVFNAVGTGRDLSARGNPGRLGLTRPVESG